jgi:hypothetical protein
MVGQVAQELNTFGISNGSVVLVVLLARVVQVFYVQLVLLVLLVFLLFQIALLVFGLDAFSKASFVGSRYWCLNRPQGMPVLSHPWQVLLFGLLILLFIFYSCNKFFIFYFLLPGIMLFNVEEVTHTADT